MPADRDKENCSRNRLWLLGLLFLLVPACGGEGERPPAPQSQPETITAPLEAPPVACDSALPVLIEAPQTLAETGLYTDVASQTLAPGILPYEPRYGLWSDGAGKGRWMYLPPCTTVDTSDMNNWSFPVGTRAFKEFSLNGVRIETRLVARTGSGPNDFLYATYLWNAEESAAELVPRTGIKNAKNTEHDVPSVMQCHQCHGSHPQFGGRPSRMLGFSAIQLSGEQLDALVSSGRLSAPPQGPVTVPGDPVAQHALGYLHANCGTCHNDSPDGVKLVDLNLWLDVGHAEVADTAAFKTAVAQANHLFNIHGVRQRIAPGNPAGSSIDYRMGERGNNAQMPPVATEQVDEEGRAAVRAWIEALP